MSRSSAGFLEADLETALIPLQRFARKRQSDRESNFRMTLTRPTFLAQPSH